LLLGNIVDFLAQENGKLSLKSVLLLSSAFSFALSFFFASFPAQNFTKSFPKAPLFPYFPVTIPKQED